MMPMMLLRPEEEKKKKEKKKVLRKIWAQRIRTSAEETSLLSGGPGPTCSHEEDACAQQDVVPFAVDASEADAEAAHHEQHGAEDGEQARGANQPCSNQRGGGKRHQPQ